MPQPVKRKATSLTDFLPPQWAFPPPMSTRLKVKQEPANLVTRPDAQPAPPPAPPSGRAPKPADLLRYPQLFFDAVAQSFNGKPVSPAAQDDLMRVLGAFRDAPPSWQAAALGNFVVEHRDMKSGSERNPPVGRYVRRELGNANAEDAKRFVGRGAVQMTGRGNYDRADKALAERQILVRGALLNNPELANDPRYWPQIYRWGVENGDFVENSERGFRMTLPAEGPATAAQFSNARNAINPKDKERADDESMAMQSALWAGRTNTLGPPVRSWLSPPVLFDKYVPSDAVSRGGGISLLPR